MSGKTKEENEIYSKDDVDKKSNVKMKSRNIGGLKLDMSLCADNRTGIPVRSASVLTQLSSSPAGISPDSLLNNMCSPRSLRRKHCSLEELITTSPPAHKARLLRMPSCVARDPTQPISGRLSQNSSCECLDRGGGGEGGNEEISEEDEENEERDTFSSNAFFTPPRQRSSTCPESRAFKRRLKVRAERRPASPPACDVEVSLLSQQLSSLVIKEELHIPARQLAQVQESD